MLGISEILSFCKFHSCLRWFWPHCLYLFLNEVNFLSIVAIPVIFKYNDPSLKKKQQKQTQKQNTKKTTTKELFFLRPLKTIQSATGTSQSTTQKSSFPCVTNRADSSYNFFLQRFCKHHPPQRTHSDAPLNQAAEPPQTEIKTCK